MFNFLIGIGIGCVIGWFLLPAPTIVTNLWKRMFGQKELVERR